MLIKVQKQVEETVEVKTPCYYKTVSGYQHVNERGQILTVYPNLISIWEPSEDKHYTSDIQNMLKYGKPCTKEKFENAYAEAVARFDKAAIGTETSAQQAFIAEADAAEGLGALAE